MNIPKKSIAAMVAVVLIAGSAAALSGVDLSGTFIKGGVPPWCIKYPPMSTPYSPEGGSTNPSPTRGTGPALLEPGTAWNNENPGSMIPGSQRAPDFSTRLYDNPVKDAALKTFKDLDKPLTSEIGGSRPGSRNGSGDTVRKGPGGVTIPDVKIPGGGGGPMSSENSPSQEPQKGDPYWWGKNVCPDGYGVDYDLLNNTCPRIKKALESGLFTEDTLPPEMKKMLPACHRHGSWFSVPKMSDDDCEAIFKAQMAGMPYDQSKYDYCYKMKPSDLYDKTYDKLNDICVEAKKNGGPLDPATKKFCEGNWWWKMLNPPTPSDCKKISSAMSSYKQAGGNYCDLPSGDSSSYCQEVYPETLPADFKPCGKGGGQ